MGHSDPSLRSSMNGRDFKESCWRSATVSCMAAKYSRRRGKLMTRFYLLSKAAIIWRPYIILPTSWESEPHNGSFPGCHNWRSLIPLFSKRWRSRPTFIFEHCKLKLSQTHKPAGIADLVQLTNEEKANPHHRYHFCGTGWPERYFPAASVLTASVVSVLPPIPH
jgi:hypothetical protein